MATSTQTDELDRILSDNDLAALMREICDIGYSHVLAFGVQLQISGNKIEELRVCLHTHNDKNDILLQILQEALKRDPPLTRREIITALQDPSVEENRLARQIQSQYWPLSQGYSQAPQTALFQQMPINQLTPPHPTSGNVPQTLSNIQPPPWPNTSELFASQQLITELPRTNQPQSNLDEVGQSHQLPASLCMLPQPTPQTSQSVYLHCGQPTLPELLRLEIPKEVGIHYITFGVHLLNDKTGSRVMALKKECQGVAEDVILRILQEWLEGKGLPVTWKTLIQTLRKTKLSTFAYQIQASLQPQPAPQTSQSVSLRPQPGPSATSLQWTPQMPAVPQLTPSVPPQTPIIPPSSNTKPSSWLENSQLVASQQLTAEVLRLNQPQPNLDQVGQSHQLPASQRMSMTPQPGPQMQHWSQLQFPPHHPDYQHLPLPIHPGYPFSHPPNLPIHRPHESQSFPPYAPSHNQYSSLQPFHSNYSSVMQPARDQYSQPFGNQSLTQLSHDQNILHPSHHTPYQQGQGHQSHQFQWQSSSQPPSQHHHSPMFPSQHFHTSDTNLPQTQESQSSPAPTFAATSESTPFLVPSPSPRQQPSPSPRQQPSPSPRQQPSPSPRQQPSPSPRQQPSPSCRQQPSPSCRQQPSPSPRQQPSPSPRQQPSPSPRQQPSPSPRQQPSPSPRQQPSPSPRQQPSPSPRQQPSPSCRQQPSPSPRQKHILVSHTGSPGPPSAKRPRQQSRYPSPPFHFSPASEAKAGHPPLVDAFIKFVKQAYSAQEVFKDEKWSLSPTEKFINLACIDRKCVKNKDIESVTKAMVMDGNVDVIQEKKGPIKFSEIAKDIFLPSSGFQQVNNRRLILVEGAPGVGKSTFAWEFCRKWMNGEIAQQYHLVLLLRLRDETIRKAQYLEDLFFHPSKGGSSAVCQELITSHTFHALIILEGYDELPDSCRNDPSSVFNELISGKLLPLATVLVTSRPWATKDLHVKHACHIYQHIEVLGFTKKQIKEYINESIRDEILRLHFDSYLEKHPQINSGMYIPLNSAIVVAVYKENIENDRQNLPNTITELYSCCIEILIRRHLKRNTGLQGGNEMNLPAINLRVPSDVHRNFVHMCHLAFSGIVEATEVKVIFNESELPEHFDNLGFMDSVTDLYVTGETVSSHNFLHLTFQEFFAAVHISTMSKEQQLQYFMEGNSDSGSKKGRLNVVLKFLAGLQKLDCFTNDTVSNIVDTPSSVSSYLIPSDITVGMDVVNWLFEAQSETAMSLILGERKVEFKASKSHMSPMDYYSLGYCISHSQCQWVLSLTSTMEISKEKIKMLADGARDVTGEAKVVELGDDALSHLKRDKLDLLFTEWNNNLSLQKLSIKEKLSVWPNFSSELRVLELCDITDEKIEFLITLIKKSSSLQRFTMSMAGYASECAHKLLELVQTIDHHPTLQEKSVKELGGCRVTTDVDVHALSQLCSKYYDSMRTNFIRYVGELSDDGVIVLADILQHKYGSRELNLSDGGTSDDGTVSLARALHYNSTIHKLKLHYNNISGKGAVALADTLHHNSTLQSLDLMSNSICNEGAVALADALHHNSTLQSLTLNYNRIGKEGAVALADALHHNSTLQSLNLGGNSIGDEGAVALADALHHNSTLQSLDLNNSIGNEGAVALADALHHNSTLQSLNLGGNSIGDEGAVALADALHHNSTLQSLTLNYNSIGDEGAVALADALHRNSTLQSLQLSRNSIGDEGAVALAEALLETQSLRLDLADNDGIGDRATGKIVEALTQNSSINKVYLPTRCREYAKKSPDYHQVQTKLSFY